MERRYICARGAAGCVAPVAALRKVCSEDRKETEFDRKEKGYGIKETR